MPQIITKKANGFISGKLAEAILEELRVIKDELSLLIPQENLSGYSRPERIKRSYQKAIKKYPPLFNGNS